MRPFQLWMVMKRASKFSALKLSRLHFCRLCSHIYNYLYIHIIVFCLVPEKEKKRKTIDFFFFLVLLHADDI